MSCTETGRVSQEPKQVSRHVYWVGVNDCIKDLFESLWPIPGGVSYNAYVVVGRDGVAVIDGVDEHLAYEYIEKVREVANDLDRVRYVVINHLEPDHHASTPRLLSLARKASVIISPVGARLVGSLYSIPRDRIVEVRDGDAVDLGDATLRFIHTPWLHWPETMMVYLEEDGVLFSCDAFGSYGALVDGVLDDEVEDLEYYIEEAKRYFSNIVQKYSKNVLEAIEKIERLGLRVSVLAPSHGPVYRKHVDRIISLYRELSLPRRRNTVTIVYGSMYGRTERLVEWMAEAFKSNGVQVETIDAARTHVSYILQLIVDSGAVVFVFPTYDASVFPPVREVMSYLVIKQSGRGRPAAIVNTFSWGPSSREALELLTKAGFRIVEPALSIKPLPDPEERRRVEELVSNIVRELGGAPGEPS